MHIRKKTLQIHDFCNDFEYSNPHSIDWQMQLNDRHLWYCISRMHDILQSTPSFQLTELQRSFLMKEAKSARFIKIFKKPFIKYPILGIATLWRILMPKSACRKFPNTTIFVNDERKVRCCQYNMYMEELTFRKHWFDEKADPWGEVWDYHPQPPGMHSR